MKLHVRALGGGPQLVILHGLLGSLDNWVPVAQKLAAHFHVFLPDLRNHGQSPHADEISYDAMAADVRELLNERQIETAHLMGHSMGGKVAMRFAQLHPRMVSKLVVVDIAPREYPPRYNGLLDGMLAIDLSTLQRREEVDVALSRNDAVGQASRLSLTSQFRLEAFGFPPVAGVPNGDERFLKMATGATPVLRGTARRDSGGDRHPTASLQLSSAAPDKALRQFLLKNLGRDESGHLFWKPNLKSIRANYDALCRGLPETRCHCPALFIRGQASDYVQPDDLALIHQLFPLARIETIPGAGHWVHANSPDRVAEVVTQFLLAES